MTVVSASCRLLDWDTEFFGFPVARADASELDPDSAAEIDRWCIAQGVRCLYLMLDPDDEESAAAADAGGYRLVDVRLTLRHDLASVPAPDPDGPIREAELRDLGALTALAARSHRDSRFYHDDGFPRERCDALYATWIEQAVRDPDRWVGVREVEGRAIGYQAVRPPGDAGVAVMEILAVDQSHRRQGIGRNLLFAGLRWGRSAGAIAVETATQERNRVSLETHLALGFVCTRREAWHHKWYRQ